MQFDRINTTSVADAISQKIKSLILGGSLKPAEKLPSERSLAKEFSVSRMSLRQGVALLVDIGLLEVRKDGTYVCDVISPSLVEPFVQLFSWYPKSLNDMLDLRLLLQKEAIKLAVERRSESDQEILSFFFEKMQDAFNQKKTPLIFESVKELHLAIVDCSYNLVLATVLRGIFSLLHSTLRDDINNEQLKKYQFIQECLYKSIILGDIQIAYDMLERHIDMIRSFTVAPHSSDTSEAFAKQSDISYRIDRTVARLEHLIVCQHFEVNKPLSELQLLAKEVGESEDIVNLALKVLLDKELMQTHDNQLYISPHCAQPLVSDPLAHLINTDWKVALDVFELRILLEENSAFQASNNEHTEKRDHLKRCLERLLTKGEQYNAQSNALDDYEFHLAIADLSENLATTYLMRGLFNILRASISNWLTLFHKEVGDISIIQDQHIAICQSINNSQPEAAKEAMRDHLQFVITTVQQTVARKEREAYAQQRLRYIKNKHS